MTTSDPSYRMAFAVINAASGAIVRTGMTSVTTFALQAGEGEFVTVLPEGVDDDTHCWNGSEFVLYPERPGAWAEWDGSSWVDPRTDESLLEEQHAQRAQASLPKLEFVMRIVMAGIISQESGLRMLDGQMPEELEGMLVGLPPEDQFHVAAKLKGAVIIERLDPFIVAAGQFLGMTDEQVDAVFGIV